MTRRIDIAKILIVAIILAIIFYFLAHRGA
jgi:hypothetical protein